MCSQSLITRGGFRTKYYRAETGRDCSSALPRSFHRIASDDSAVANPCETSALNRLNPPPVRLPKLVQGVGFAVFRRKAMRNWIKRHGRIFEINVPFFGRSVVVSDPALVRSVCTASAEQLINVQPNLSNLVRTRVDVWA